MRQDDLGCTALYKKLRYTMNQKLVARCFLSDFAKKGEWCFCFAPVKIYEEDVVSIL